MEVKFYEINENCRKITGADDTTKIDNALSQAFKSGSEFAKKHGLNDTELRNFSSYLNHNEVTVRGNDVNEILKDLGKHAKDFKRSITNKQNAAKLALVRKVTYGTAGAAAVVGLGSQMPTALEKAGDVLMDYEDAKHVRNLVQSFSQPGVLFPKELLNVTKEDRAHPKFVEIVKLKLGEENLLREPHTYDKYFTMVITDPEGKPSFERVHMNEKELKAAFNLIDAEVKRRQGSISVSSR